MSNRRVRGVTKTFETVLLAAILAVVIIGVLRPLMGPAGFGLGTGPIFGAPPSIDTTLDAAAVRIDTEPSLPTLQGPVTTGDGIEFAIPTGTTVSVTEPDIQQQLAFVAVPVLSALLTIGVLMLLLQIARTLHDGDPFVAANARRLYMIAGLVGIGGQIAVALQLWSRWTLLTHPQVAPYVLVDQQLSVLPLVAGLGIATAAEVFRQGTILRAEVEGLV